MSRFPRNGVDDDAFQINVITSDITYMKDTYCVAGWHERENPPARKADRSTSRSDRRCQQRFSGVGLREADRQA